MNQHQSIVHKLPVMVAAVLFAACAPAALPDDVTPPDEPDEVEAQSVEASDTPEPTATDTPEPTPAPPTPTGPPALDPDRALTPAIEPETEDDLLPQTFVSPLVQAVVDALASQLGVEPDAVTVASVQSVTWNDSSLGCPQPGMMYLQVLTPGYLVILEADGNTYEYHLSEQGNFVSCTSGATPMPGRLPVDQGVPLPLPQPIDPDTVDR